MEEIKCNFLCFCISINIHLLDINCFPLQGYELLGFAEVDVDEALENTQEPGFEETLYGSSDDFIVEENELDTTQDFAPSVIVTNLHTKTNSVLAPDACPVAGTSALASIDTTSTETGLEAESNVTHSKVCTNASDTLKTRTSEKSASAALVPSRLAEPCIVPGPAKVAATIGETVHAGPVPGLSDFNQSVLVNLLQRTVVGNQLLERSVRGALSNNSQRELVNIIAEHHCELGLPTTKEILQRYAEAITIQFKYETQVCKILKLRIVLDNTPLTVTVSLEWSWFA